MAKGGCTHGAILSSIVWNASTATETKSLIEQDAASVQPQQRDDNVTEKTSSVDGEKDVALVVQEERSDDPEAVAVPQQQQQQEDEPTTSLLQEENESDDKALNLNHTNKQEDTSSPRETEQDKDEPDESIENPLLAKEAAEERAHQWSASTVSVHSPLKKHSPMEMDESEEEQYGEMTQGTSNAVAALTVLASGGRGKQVLE